MLSFISYLYQFFYRLAIRNYGKEGAFVSSLIITSFIISLNIVTLLNGLSLLLNISLKINLLLFLVLQIVINFILYFLLRKSKLKIVKSNRKDILILFYVFISFIFYVVISTFKNS